MPPKEESGLDALILCIDRDDDLGKKAGVRGPIIGEEDNLKAAKLLGLSDPEDTDMNAVYAAVKTLRECRHIYHKVEVATLTGDKEVGIKSDQKISLQLERLLEEFNPKGVILVTDGAEDDELLPIIQSRVKILSKKTVTVKQSKQLESAYFKLIDFFSNIGDDPHRARMLLALPGTIIFLIVLLSLFHLPVVEVIFGLIGFYLVAKGFGFDKQLEDGLNETKNSLLGGNIYKVFNAFAILIIFLALVTGYLRVQENLDQIYEGSTFTNPSSVTEAFISQPAVAITFFFVGSIDLLLVAVLLMAAGFTIHNFLEKRYINIKKYLYISAFFVILRYLSQKIYWVVISLSGSAVDLEIPTTRDPFQDLVISLLLAVVAFVILHYIVKIVFFDYIQKKQNLEEKFLEKEVYTHDGKKIGTVSNIDFRGTEMRGLYVKKRYIPHENIKSKGKVLVMGAEKR
jgi:uncharacterized membrane protein